jgi:hypothetical protein
MLFLPLRSRKFTDQSVEKPLFTFVSSEKLRRLRVRNTRQ